jgi:hypothetical protein
MAEMCQQLLATPEDHQNRGVHELLERIYCSW